jgi:hypothetical protein
MIILNSNFKILIVHLRNLLFDFIHRIKPQTIGHLSFLTISYFSHLSNFIPKFDQVVFHNSKPISHFVHLCPVLLPEHLQ